MLIPRRDHFAYHELEESALSRYHRALCRCLATLPMLTACDGTIRPVSALVR